MTTFTTYFGWPKPSGTDSPDGAAQIGALADPADLAMRIATNQASFVPLGGCALGTMSATYVDITGASKSWTKIGSAAQSDVMVHVSLSGFVIVGSTVFAVGVNINGSNTDATLLSFANASLGLALPSAWVRISGVPAGVETVKLRAKRNSGTGTLGIDAGGTVSFRVEEKLL